MAANGNVSVFVVRCFCSIDRALRRGRRFPAPLAGQISEACWQRADGRAGAAQQGQRAQGGELASAGRNVDRGMHDRQPRAVFASFTVDTMFLSTTSDPWTGPRRSARAARRSPAAPRSAASAGGRRSGRESWVHPRSVAEVEADRLHHLERRALGEDVGGREHPGVLLDHGCGCGSDHSSRPPLNAAQGLSPYFTK